MTTTKALDYLQLLLAAVPIVERILDKVGAGNAAEVMVKLRNVFDTLRMAAHDKVSPAMALEHLRKLERSISLADEAADEALSEKFKK